MHHVLAAVPVRRGVPLAYRHADMALQTPAAQVRVPTTRHAIELMKHMFKHRGSVSRPSNPSQDRPREQDTPGMASGTTREHRRLGRACLFLLSLLAVRAAADAGAAAVAATAAAVDNTSPASVAAAAAAASAAAKVGFLRHGVQAQGMAWMLHLMQLNSAHDALSC